MTNDDLQRIESELGIRLPQSFMHFMLNYPPALRSTRWTMDTGDGTQHTESPAENELCDRADGIIALNKDNPQEYQYSARLTNWPAGFLIIGAGGCGEVFAINAEVEDSPVYRAEPSSGMFDPAIDGIELYFDELAPSIADFAQGLIESYKANPYYDDSQQ